MRFNVDLKWMQKEVFGRGDPIGSGASRRLFSSPRSTECASVMATSGVANGRRCDPARDRGSRPIPSVRRRRWLGTLSHLPAAVVVVAVLGSCRGQHDQVAAVPLATDPARIDDTMPADPLHADSTVRAPSPNDEAVQTMIEIAAEADVDLDEACVRSAIEQLTAAEARELVESAREERASELAPQGEAAILSCLTADVVEAFVAESADRGAALDTACTTDVWNEIASFSGAPQGDDVTEFLASPMSDIDTDAWGAPFSPFLRCLVDDAELVEILERNLGRPGQALAAQCARDFLEAQSTVMVVVNWQPMVIDELDHCFSR